MLWLRSHLEGRPLLEAAIFNRFETIVRASGGPTEMLLVKQNHGRRVSTLWLRLPDQKYRAVFEEFEDANEADLPQRATLLVGHNAEFEQLFEYDA